MNIQWFPGHMAKARREIEEKLKVVDIALVLVDARIPISSQNPMAMEILKNKPQLMILTKSDMADNNMTKKWEKYFLNQGKKAIFIDSISGLNVKKIETLAKEILKEKIERDLKRGMKMRPIRAIIVGIPNVGKSTLINKLAGKKVANVGNMPGVTKAQQWIRLNQNLELLDTPGILWPKFDDDVALNLASLTAIKEEILPLDVVVEYILDTLNKYYPEILKNRYNLENYSEDYIENLEWIGKKRGCLERGGIVDYDKVYSVILNDMKSGLIRGITFDRI